MLKRSGLLLLLLTGNASALERRHIPPADLQAPAAVKAEAGPLAEAFAAYYCGDYGRAAQIWQPLAEAGNGEAQFNLAYLYQKGLGVERFPSKAQALYEPLASAGNARAQNNLAASYYRDWPQDSNLAKARALYEQAAAAGDPKAQFNLAELHAGGWLGGRDYAQALALYERAAAGGHVRAPGRLSDFYDPDSGLEKDAAKAREWNEKYEKAKAADRRRDEETRKALCSAPQPTPN